MEYRTQTSVQTQELAREIASNLINSKKREHALVIAFSGDLGSGKTTFIQGFIDGLGIKSRVVSPTFILMREYGLFDLKVYHLDTYRLSENPYEEVKDLGLQELFQNRNAIVLIEWAEKIKNILPDDTIWMRFEYVSDTERKITYEKN